MLNEIKRDPKKETDYKDAPFMKQYEKDISFLNRFFIYKKTSTRNAEKLTKVLLEQLPDEYDFENAGTMLAREAVQEAVELVKPKAKKIGKKLKLQEEPEQPEEGKQEQIPEKPEKQEKPVKTKKPAKKSEKKIITALEIQEVPAEDLVPVETEVMELVPKTKKTKGKKKIVEFEVIEEDK
jgi:hypothetical protein